MKPVNVLVVDDSSFIRSTVSNILTKAGFNVVAQAKNGLEALKIVHDMDNIDIVTMDVEMPVMNGIEAVKSIMNTSPLPIIMLSSIDQKSAHSTTEALSAGAVDFISKSSAFTQSSNVTQELVSKVSHFASNSELKKNFIKNRLLSKKITHSPTTPAAETSPATNKKVPAKILCIGISTGGPAALQILLPKLPANFPVPIVIVQHMPMHFTAALADRLDKMSQIKIKEIKNHEILKAGTAYFAPGGMQTEIHDNFRANIVPGSSSLLFKPSVDFTLNSLIKAFGKHTMALIMTGMGKDGLNALKQLSAIGGYIMAQDISSSTIAGMNKAAIDANITNEIHSLTSLPLAICKIFNVKHRSSMFDS